MIWTSYTNYHIQIILSLSCTKIIIFILCCLVKFPWEIKLVGGRLICSPFPSDLSKRLERVSSYWKSSCRCFHLLQLILYANKWVLSMNADAWVVIADHDFCFANFVGRLSHFAVQYVQVLENLFSSVVSQHNNFMVLVPNLWLGQ